MEIELIYMFVYMHCHMLLLFLFDSDEISPHIKLEYMIIRGFPSKKIKEQSYHL